MAVKDLIEIHEFPNTAMTNILGAKPNGFWAYQNSNKIVWVDADIDNLSGSSFTVTVIATIPAFGGFTSPDSRKAVVIGDNLWVALPIPNRTHFILHKFSESALLKTKETTLFNFLGSGVKSVGGIGAIFDAGVAVDDHVIMVAIRQNERMVRTLNLEGGGGFASLSDHRALPVGVTTKEASPFGENWRAGNIWMVSKGATDAGHWVDIQTDNFQPPNAQTFRVFQNGLLSHFPVQSAATVVFPEVDPLYPTLFVPTQSHPAEVLRREATTSGRLDVHPMYYGALSEFQISSLSTTPATLRANRRVFPYSGATGAPLQGSNFRRYVNVVGHADLDSAYALFEEGGKKQLWSSGQLDICPLRSLIPLDQGTRIESEGFSMYLVETPDHVADNPNLAGYLHATGIAARDHKIDLNTATQEVFAEVMGETIQYVSLGLISDDKIKADSLNPYRIVLRMLPG